MTRFPTESRKVTGLEVDESHPAIRVGPVCAVPECTRLTDHAHHLFSRGLMGGDYKWVSLEDNTEIFNLLPLCYRHHEQVTNNEVAIVWDGECFTWGEGGMAVTWTPPVILPEQKHVVETVSYAEAKELGVENPHKYCPTCKRKFHPDRWKDNKPEAKRPRLTVGIAVPGDKAENGAEVLGELIEATRVKLDQHGLEYGDGRKNMYFIITTALALFVTHADEILSDG